MKKIIAVFLIFECCLVPTLINGQQKTENGSSSHLKETGLPLIRNYTPDDYNAFTQNWSAVQDTLGIMYFGNGDGVLTYNGTEWHLIELPNNSIVFSLARHSDGTIFVGGRDEVGYITPDSLGQLSYKSLVQKLPLENQKFDRISSVYSAKDRVYFCSDSFIAEWDGSKFTVWELECGARMKTYFLQNTLYTSCIGKGLMQLVGKGFSVPKGADFFSNMRVNVMLDYDKDRKMIATDSGIYLYGSDNVTEFRTNTPDFFKDNIIYCGVNLNNGAIALGSLYKGILIFDKSGTKKAWITQETQLLTDQVLGLYQDHSGMLWASLFSGISKIEYPSPFGYYHHSKESPKLVYEILRFNDTLYIGGPDGLFFLRKAISQPNATLDRVEGDVGMVWDLVNMNNSMLVGGMGIHEIEKDSKVKKVNDLMSPVMLRSKVDSNRVFIGLSPGLTSLYNQDGQWTIEENYKEVHFEVGTMREDSQGNLWLGSYNSQILKMYFKSFSKAKKLEDPKFRIYDSKDGLPEDIGHPLIFEGQVCFVVSNGETYKYDPAKDRFYLDFLIYDKLGLKDKNVILNSIDGNGNIWILEKENEQVTGQYYAKLKDDDSYEVTHIDANRIKNFRRGALLDEVNDSIIWYRGKSGIIRHDLRKLPVPDRSPKAMISKLIYRHDSLVYGGYGKLTNVQIPFSQNQFRFQFASPSFIDEEQNIFQYFLQGYEEGWSAWTGETFRDYTNIDEGNYTFRLRAKNIYGLIGNEDTFTFTILPPWYRTWWAYLFYTVLGAFAIWLFAQWRSKQLYRKNLILENIIKQRTEEISKKNKLLTYQSDRLKEMDTMKTRLFANISHEFRTPLTLIKGPIEKLEKEQRTTISIPNIKMIRRNANRLLNLVNQLLDLSKLDSGKLRLHMAEGDVFKCIRAAASAFSSHAVSRNMDYQVKIPFRLLWAEFDRDKMEKIIYNLLSNAFKFTQDGGRVNIQAEFRSNRVNLKISDTGSGIHAKKLPHIFDRFFQVDDSYTREKAGSGIGLALTKELVELMGGTIFVESEVGRGTLFRVVVPLEEIKSGEIHEEEQDIPITVFEDDEQQATTISAAKDVKMLIIEDNNDMRHFIREQLEGEYDIVEARNGKEGLQMANKLVPDLIITDLMMPQMDGITLCKKLKSNINTSHIPVIMLTAKAGIENKLEGLETGADEYLTKPFNARELQIRSKNLIEQRQQLREIFSKNISLDPQEVTVTSMDEKFLKSTLTLLEEKYADSQFGVPQMQKELGMGKTSLHNKLKALTNHPPGELLRNFRLQRATQLLTQHVDNISQVAFDVGFNSPSYFTRCFKEYYGSLPSDYLKNES